MQVEGVEASDETARVPATAAAGEWRTEGSAGAAKARLDAGGAHAGLLGGSPLTLLQGIIPGTTLIIVSRYATSACALSKKQLFTGLEQRTHSCVHCP